MADKNSENEKKAKKHTKGEIIAYAVLGLMAVAIAGLVLAVFLTAGTAGGGTGIILPCCQ